MSKVNDLIDRRLLQYFEAMAPKIEQYARTNAPWQDQTGDARAGLTGIARQDAVGVGHTVEYGVDLELGHDGAYSILDHTVEHYIPDIKEGISRIVKKTLEEQKWH